MQRITDIEPNPIYTNPKYKPPCICEDCTNYRKELEVYRAKRA